MKLVVLESPNKVEKVSHYLGAGYKVLATAGHFRDLPDDAMGVDTKTWTPTFTINPKKKDLVDRIKAAAAGAEEVLLASDADREGEAISWHLAQVLGLKKPMRLKYTEITEKALKEAITRLVPLDQNLADAQLCRRIQDRLIGYEVSPKLTPYFGKGASAGRVQSATLHLVVAREIEREQFKPVPYWTLASKYQNGLVARYASLNDKGELVDTRLTTSAEAEAIATRARAATHTVSSVATKPVERKPKAPFTTSTLQQAASSQLGFKPDQTMKLAQALFERGAISYHRTDSVALSEDAITLARDFITADYPKALPAQPVRYKVKGDAQGAHEAIRPTSLDPATVAELQGDEAALYDLIRRRFLACQSKPAVFDQTTVTITAGDTIWRAVGAVVQFDGFLHYLTDSEDQEDNADEPRLPRVANGEVLSLADITVAAKTTKPPPRFTQATLVREMERTGIGRPSTYATTVTTLFDRTYIAEEKKDLYPTPRGRGVDTFLARGLPELLDTDLTAQMEARLDAIADGQARLKPELQAWWSTFEPKLRMAPQAFEAEAKNHPALAAEAAARLGTPTDKVCPQCQKPLLLRTRKDAKGQFLSCSGYPVCNYAANPAARSAGKPCPRCGKDLNVLPRKSGDGEYLACSGYPACDYKADATAKAYEKPCPKCSGPMEQVANKAGVPYARCVKKDCGGLIDLAPAVAETCPVCASSMTDKGDFLSCTKYPACKGSYDKKGLAKSRKNNWTCPKCAKPLMERKSAKGAFLGCSAYPVCKHITPLPSTVRNTSR